MKHRIVATALCALLLAPGLSAAQTNDGSEDETRKTEADGSDKGLSQGTQYTDPPSPFVIEWIG